MKRTITSLTVLLAALTFTLTGCSDDSSDLPSDDGYSYYDDSSTDDSGWPDDDEIDSMSPDEMAQKALELAWDQQSVTDQASMCWLWTDNGESGKETLMEAFSSTAGDSFDESMVADFMDEHC